MGRSAPNGDFLQEGADPFKADGYLIAKSVLPRSRPTIVFVEMVRLVNQQLRLHQQPMSAANGWGAQKLGVILDAVTRDFLTPTKVRLLYA